MPEILGQTFHKLTVIEQPLNRQTMRSFVTCRCSCGFVKLVRIDHLIRHETRSCGCYRNQRIRETMSTHGLTHTKEYQSWSAMLRRCYNPNVVQFKWYGAKGVTVCDRWRQSFESFLSDMGHRPTSIHSIDRINPEGNYEPENCRWATRKEQALNKRPKSHP